MSKDGHMPPFTPRPVHLLVAGVGLGLALMTASGIGCGAKQRGAAVVKGEADPRQADFRNSRAEAHPASQPLASPRTARDDSSAVVEALERKAQQVTREMDPGSLRRSTNQDAPDGARQEFLRLGSSPSPPDAPAAVQTPSNGATEANGPAVVSKRLSGKDSDGQGVFINQHNELRSDVTTPREEGAALTERLTQRVRDYPLDLSAHLDYQLHRFAMGETVPQLQSMSPLPQEDRDALVAMLDGLSNFRSGVQADANMLLSKKVQPLIEMADRIRAQAELTLPVVALCGVGTVRGFGVYEPLPHSLKAGQDHPAILYVEVGNFSSRRNEKSQLWETKLKQEAVLYTESGLAVWSDKSNIPVDTSRNRRHDFYVYKGVTLPRTLTVGRYFLKVTITDEQANRVAENSLPVQVVAQ
jgi:hypothetical protein